MERPKIALVLSGGGARGAYEAGVIRYLREELPPAARENVRFDLICGVSVGAITACHLASTMDIAAEQGRLLASIWTDLSLEQVYGVEGQDLWTIARGIWRLTTNEPVRAEGWRLYDLLHPEPLEEMVRTRIPWSRISANLARGLFSALSVTATQINNGQTVVFVQQRDSPLPTWSRDPSTLARDVVIGPEHALASSAIPLLFRSVKIGEEYFCDGSLRQSTPLSPALRLGADRVLIISLKYRSADPVAAPNASLTYPTTPVLMGKVLNALLLDHTDYDLDRLRRFNQILQAGKEAFGEQFAPKMNEVVTRSRGQPYRTIHDLVLRPSRNISAIAAAHAKRKGSAPLSQSLPTKMLHRLAQSQLVNESDLASYLLFDGAYAKELVELAMEDTHHRRDDLIRFFDPDQAGAT